MNKEVGETKQYVKTMAQVKLACAGVTFFVLKAGTAQQKSNNGEKISVFWQNQNHNEYEATPVVLKFTASPVVTDTYAAQGRL